ncbi:30S ribosomal chloroplastic [Chlorella sorokiniana]|uniref:30S ribosomal chloroplastic n=1 Tax=Chlorella sorokiniana TaxID=3076 RepID=A0A2P6U0S9_CHLSO|nr:30S ribosomal chloroplastic [Chlorella sorokiniana]|eukprot:PRW59921.1 30S ribosomal chloroplastic [Chlorella sorokiniana]
MRRRPHDAAAARHIGNDDSGDEYDRDLGLGKEEAEYARWAAEAEAEFGSLEEAYEDFEARLGRPSAPAPSSAKPKRGGNAQGGLVAPQRPRGAPALPPAPPAGRVQLQLGRFARPPKLAAKPQASQEALPAKPKRQLAAAAAVAKPPAAAAKPAAAAAAPAVEPKPPRPAASPLRQLKEQRLAEERERKVAEAARRATFAQELKERRESNAAYGQDRLLDRQAETLTVWQINSAGVLVRNKDLSGFIPSSLLSPLNVAAVLEAERPLLAAAAAGAIVAQLETQGQPGQSADGADLDPATRAAARRQALEAVLLGRQVTAQVVSVDAASGRVVLSERAAVSAWKERGVKATPPSSAELQVAAGMLGEVVDATVVHVKPFGAFLEFQAELPSFMGGTAADSERAVLVGLVHRSEVSWDPEVSIADALQIGQQVKAKLLHVDAAKARIFLSIRRTTANPLLETLDSLVTSAAAAASAGGSSSSAGVGGRGADAGSEGAPAAAPAAPLDERPLLGDLPEAVRFCELMVEVGRGAVLSATPGVRLQSRAASQELEVYLAKDASAGIGAAVAAAGGAAEPAAAAAVPGPPDASTFNLVLRCARTVQEVAVQATCSRDEVRQLIAASISQLAAEVEAAAEVGV